MSALYDCPNPRCVDGDAYRAEVSRLQARWDARDETLRALIEKWRRRVDDRQRVAAESDNPDAHDGFISGTTVCTSELERAIGGGDD